MSDAGFLGALDPSDASSDYNSHAFLIRQILATVQGATLVQVIACTGSGGLAPVGFVDVRPMVHQLDGSGVAIPHGPVHNLPFFRLQGGANAVIIDPTPGDIGIAIFADRDLSAVKSNRAPSPPGSSRRNDWADGLYIGGFLNAAPNQFVQFTAAGIQITSPQAITLAAPIVTVNAPAIVLNGQLTQGTGSNGGAATLAGPVTVQGDLTATGTSLHGHKHTSSVSGSPTSAPL